MSKRQTTIDDFAGLDLLSSAVILLDGGLLIRHLNPAAENLFSASQRIWLGRPLKIGRAHV
jgi:two-component system nitrogen regulation sensor histidine kinase GlnL